MDIGLERMKNWHGSGGMFPSSSNLSAFAMPFTAPREYLYPNSMPGDDLSEVSSAVPSSGEVNSCDSPGFLPNLYPVSSYKVDPIVTTRANYPGFPGPETSREMNCHPFSRDLPVGVSSTNDVATRLGGLGGNNGADPRGYFYPYSMSRVDPGEGSGVVPLSGEGNSWDGPGFMPNLYSFSSYKVDPIVPTHANYSGFLGPGTICEMNGQPFSCGRPTDHVTSRLGVLGDPSFSLSRRSTSSISKPVIGKSGDSFYDNHTKVFSRDTCDDRLEETAVTCPLKGAHQTNGSDQLEGANLASQHAAGTCNIKDSWIDGWGRPSGEYPPRSVRVVGEESWARAPHPELSSDIWKEQTPFTPLWEHSKTPWCNGSNPDYENLVMKSASLPAAASQADASTIPIGQVTPSNGNSGIGRNDEIIADFTPFQEAKSYPLLDTEFKLHFDATYHNIQPDPYAFGNMSMADGEGLPKEKFSSKNSFNHMLHSGSRHRFPSLHLENTYGQAGSHLARDLSTSIACSIHHSDRGTDSLVSDKGPISIKSLDQPWWEVISSPDVPVKSDSRASSHRNPTGNLDQEICEKGPGSFFKPPAISCTPDGKRKFDGTVEVGPSWSKEIQSPHGTGGTTATEHVLNEGKESPVQVEGNSTSCQSAHAPENLSEKEKSKSIPKVDIHAMVLTLHNLSELLYYYSLTGECEVTGEDCHLLEKVIHNFASSSSKDVVVMANCKKVLENLKEELTSCSEVTSQIHMLEDQFYGDNGSVKSMSSSEENCSGMLSSGVDQQAVVNNNYTEILNDGKQQSTGKDKFRSKAIKDILDQHCHDWPESDPQVHFFRNLWLEAEVELCSQNCRTRFDHVKSKFDAFGMKDCSGTRSIEQNKNMTDSPRSCNNSKVSGASDGMARFALRGRSRDLVGAPPPLITAQDNEADILTEKASSSPRVSHSSILIGTRCHGENIDDDVISRFKILLRWHESFRSKGENSARAETDEGVTEEKMCTTATGFPEHNSETVASTFPEHMENLCPLIPDISVMSRWNNLKQRNEIAGTFENVGHQETVEVEPREEPVDGRLGDRGGYFYSDIAHYHNRFSSSCCGEPGTGSVLERLKVLKLRDGHQNSAEDNLMFRESVDLGAAVRGDYLSSLKERAVEGSTAKANDASQKAPADNAAKLDNGLGRGNNPAVGSFIKGKTSGGWFDIASSDWEHVLKEEVTGRTTEP